MEDALVVIPGIMGSELFFAGKLCWPPVGEEALSAGTTLASAARLFAEAGNRMMRLAREKLSDRRGAVPACGFPVRFADGGEAALREGPPGYIENGRAGAYNKYMDLCDYFHRRNPSLPVYFFGYDWRRSCAENAQRLGGFISRIRTRERCRRVKIAAHSLGCLVAAHYLRQFGSGAIAAAATAGGPFLGAEAVKPFLHRCLTPEGFPGFPGQRPDALSPLLTASVLPAVYRVAENCRSLRELLPSACAEIAAEPAWDGIPHYNFAGTGEKTLEVCGRAAPGGGADGADVYGDGDGQVLAESATAGGRFRHTIFYRATHAELISREKCLQDIYDSLYNS